MPCVAGPARGIGAGVGKGGREAERKRGAESPGAERSPSYLRPGPEAVAAPLTPAAGCDCSSSSRAPQRAARVIDRKPVGQVCQRGGSRAEDGYTALGSFSFPLKIVSSYCFSIKSACFIRNDFYNLKEKYVPEAELPVAGVGTHLGSPAASLHFPTAATSEQRQVTGANPRLKQKIRESPGGGEQERCGCGQWSLHGRLRGPEENDCSPLR